MDFSIVALVTAAVTFIVVVTTTVVYANKAITIQKDYNSKITTLTSDMNSAQEAGFKYNKQQDSSITSTEQTLSTVKSDYAKRADLEKSFTTGALTSKTLNTDKIIASEDINSKGLVTGKIQGSTITASGDITSANINTGKIASSAVSTDALTAKDVTASKILTRELDSKFITSDILDTKSIIGHDLTFYDPDTSSFGGIGLIGSDLKVIGPSKGTLSLSFLDDKMENVNDAVTLGANLDAAFKGGLTVEKDSIFILLENPLSRVLHHLIKLLLVGQLLSKALPHLMHQLLVVQHHSKEQLHLIQLHLPEQQTSKLPRRLMKLLHSKECQDSMARLYLVNPRILQVQLALQMQLNLPKT
jgi:hypothetical protein